MVRRLQDKYRDPLLLPKTSFGERFAWLNGLADAGFVAWDFLPGMRFGERAAWWRDGADRGTAHEGLDLLWYRTGDGGRARLLPGARVPVLWPGEVVSIVPDFLGASVFVAHGLRDARGGQLHSVYGHLRPGARVVSGGPLADGQEVGVIAEPPAGRAPVPGHLHLSVAWIDRKRGPERLDWGSLQDESHVFLLDPLSIVTTSGH